MAQRIAEKGFKPRALPTQHPTCLLAVRATSAAFPEKLGAWFTCLVPPDLTFFNWDPKASALPWG